MLNAAGEIFGYVIGNDVSSRSIEGENPLYLPQAKVYDRSCALGPGDRAGLGCARPAVRHHLPGRARGRRSRSPGSTSTASLTRPFDELAAWLTAALTFPTAWSC